MKLSYCAARSLSIRLQIAGCISAAILFALPQAIFAQGSRDLTSEIASAPVFYQNLVTVGDTVPSQVENQALWQTVADMKLHGAESNVPALEQFMAAYPDSPWTPALEANLARYYYEHGRYTRALELWQTVWNTTGKAQSGSAKEVADFAFAYWTRLLASLGRVDTLAALFQETEGRTFDAGPLQQIVNSTREALSTMRTQPGICFRCGTFALLNIAKNIKGPTFDPATFLGIPSPATGFTMTKLLEIARQQGLDLLAVEWGADKTPVIPSIIHWKQDHYAAIMAERNGSFFVLDPTFGKPKWLTRDVILQEASGQFLVPRNKLPAGWKTLGTAETDQIYGRGFPYGIYDPFDGCGNGSGGSDPEGAPAQGAQSGNCSTCGGGGSCPTCPAGGGPGPGSQGGNGPFGGGPKNQLSAGAMMPIWQVSEPYITVWLHDRPIPPYQPGLGPVPDFAVAYKQRDSRSISTNFFSLGKMWQCSWLSYLLFGGDGDDRPVMTVPGGGERDYYPGHEYFVDSTADINTDVNGTTTGYTVHFGDGSRDEYGFIPTNALMNMEKVAFLSARVDAYSHSNSFVYVQTNNVVKLLSVTDADGHTNTLLYTNTVFPSQISGVRDPFGRTAIFKYDSNPSSVSYGMITNLTDSATNTSFCHYDSRGWLTNLITPYGTNTFEYFTNTGGADEFQGTNQYAPARVVRVVDPVGGTNLFMLHQDASNLYRNGQYIPLIPNNYDPSIIPTNGMPDDVANMLDMGLLLYRDTFHWGPRQAANLPSDISTFAVSHYQKARMRHWRHDAFYLSDIGQSLSIQQDFSPDGVGIGQTTWFGYEGGGAPYAGFLAPPNVIAKVLPDGTTSYRWLRRDEWGHPTNIVETYSLGYGQTPLTRTNLYIYDGPNLIQQIGPRGETLAGYFYDSASQLLRATNAVGDVAYYAYDNQGRLINSKSSTGLNTDYVYNGSGEYANWVATNIDREIGRTNSFTYTNDLVYTHLDERGVTTTNTYDNFGRVISVSDPRGAITYTYSNLDLVKITDRMGFTESFVYDRLRRLACKTNALGFFTQYNYCSCGALDSIRDAQGNYTYFFYDGAGRLFNTVYPDNYAITNSLDLLGRTVIRTDSGGYSVTNWFNNQGLRYAETTASGNIEFINLDINDRATNAVNNEGVSITNTFDDLGRLRTRKYPDGSTEKFGYSAAGVIAYTNQIGMSNFFAYDAAGRKTFETNANGELIRYTNNPAGDLISLTDGKTQTTRWNFDQYGRVTNKVDQAGTEILRYIYDPDNRLTNRWSAAKGNTKYSYDAVGNPSSIQYPASGTVTFAYDGLNRMTNMVDGTGTTKYTYNAAGQLLTEDGPFASDTVTNAYSKRLRTKLSLQQPTGVWTNGFGYDITRRLTNVISPAGAFGYSYDPTVLTHHASRVILPNTSYITNALDGNARLIGSYLKNSGNTVLDSYTYVYDPANERTNLSRADASTVGFKYDKIGQLTVADSSINTEDRGYTYDAGWNLNWLTNNGPASQFLVDNKNELTNAPGGIISYDSNGNMTNFQGSHHALSYDDENRLIDYLDTVTGDETAFIYDGLGRLRIRQEYQPGISSPSSSPVGGGVLASETHYLYDGWRVIQERDVNNTPTVSYTRGDDLSGTMQGAGGIGGLLARSAGYSSGNWTTHNYYFCDGNGNITYMLNSSQAMAASYRYDPFGNTISKSGTVADANVYRFSSKEIHVNSGMYYFGYRFYDPNLQRWITRDPLPEKYDLNLYGFVYNNSLSWFDRNGLVADGVTPPPVGLSPENAQPSLGDMVYTLGLIANSPNTALGLGLGLAGLPFGGSTPTFGNNALQFENNPLMFGGDITLGNVICYRRGMGPNDPLHRGSPYTFGDHERQHTYQGMQLGPNYLPDYVVFGTISKIQGGEFFGAGNAMEDGPNSTPPRIWK
jgi:RHS repeat-associated protein